MADTTEAAPKFYVPLLANSYDLQALEKELEHAFNLKTDQGQAKAVQKAVTGGAQLKDVLTEQGKPAVPEGCVIAEVQAADGRVVTAPVAIPGEEEEAPEPEAPEPEAPTPPPSGRGARTPSPESAD